MELEDRIWDMVQEGEITRYNVDGMAFDLARGTGRTPKDVKDIIDNLLDRWETRESKENKMARRMEPQKGEVEQLIDKMMGEKYVGFKKLKKQIGQKGGVRDPGAVAPAVGKKKYGAKAMKKAAAGDKSLRGAPTKTKKKGE